ISGEFDAAGATPRPEPSGAKAVSHQRSRLFLPEFTSGLPAARDARNGVEFDSHLFSHRTEPARAVYRAGKRERGAAAEPECECFDFLRAVAGIRPTADE